MKQSYATLSENPTPESRTPSGPGHYTLGENARLVVSHRLVGTRIVNEASIPFFSPDPTKPAPRHAP